MRLRLGGGGERHAELHFWSWQYLPVGGSGAPSAAWGWEDGFGVTVEPGAGVSRASSGWQTNGVNL